MLKPLQPIAAALRSATPGSRMEIPTSAPAWISDAMNATPINNPSVKRVARKVY